MEKESQEQKGQTIIINQEGKQSNGFGIAGFILALLTLFLGWIPIIGWLLWLLALVFSLVGIFKKPKGLAIAGLVLSVIGLITVLTGVGILASL